HGGCWGGRDGGRADGVPGRAPGRLAADAHRGRAPGQHRDRPPAAGRARVLDGRRHGCRGRWPRPHDPRRVRGDDLAPPPGGRVSGRRRIAVVPAYNEEPTVVGVLERLAPVVDQLVVVDDGSTDGTRAAIE